MGTRVQKYRKIQALSWTGILLWLDTLKRTNGIKALKDITDIHVD